MESFPPSGRGVFLSQRSEVQGFLFFLPPCWHLPWKMTTFPSLPHTTPPQRPFSFPFGMLAVAEALIRRVNPPPYPLILDPFPPTSRFVRTLTKKQLSFTACRSRSSVLVVCLLFFFPAGISFPTSRLSLRLSPFNSSEIRPFFFLQGAASLLGVSR